MDSLHDELTPVEENLAGVFFVELDWFVCFRPDWDIEVYDRVVIALKNPDHLQGRFGACYDFVATINPAFGIEDTT